MRPPVALAGYDFTERLGLGGRLAGDLGPADPGQGEDQVERRAKLVRLTYDQETDTLGQPTELIAGIPAGTDHNAGRVKFGPDGMLYYPTGDQGGNGLANYCNPIRAQVLPTADQISAKDWSSYTGKILRLTPDGASLRTSLRSRASGAISSPMATAIRRGSCSARMARSIRPSTARRPTTRST